MLGRGGFGTVYRAEVHGDGGFVKEVAVKVLNLEVEASSQHLARLRDEARMLGLVRHRALVGVDGLVKLLDRWTVVMEYVDGVSLGQLLQSVGPFPLAIALQVVEEVASGLHAAYTATDRDGAPLNLLHRDVKPSNVLMEGRTPILIDFGLARVADDPKLTHTGWLLGTPGYLAPEILYGEDATTASDVHSWAATVAYAGLGRPPFGRGPSMAIMDRVRRGQFDLEGLPPELHQVVAAALDPEPRKRPTLEQILAWLRPQTTRRADPPAAPPVAVEHDPYTVPLALASQAAADDVTDVWPGHDRAEPHTLALAPAGRTAYLADPAPPPVSLAERFRRATLLGGLALVGGAALAAFPWVTTLLLLLLVWLMRSGSLAGSAHDQRRQYRGRKWYDGAQLLVAAPWHLVQSIPGTLLLALWSLGLAVAAALVCYAFATGLALALFVCGVVLAVSLWLGPGGSRVRGPVNRVVQPLAADPGRWVVALLVVLAAAAALGFRADLSGPTWTPDDTRPHAEIGGLG